MRIQYIIEKVSLKGIKERSVKEFEKLEVFIGRGSGADILLRESIVAFLHARLVQKEGKLFIEKVKSHKSLISVNGRFIKQCLLATGDKITIGNTTLTVSSENKVWQLIEVRKELTKEEEELWLSGALARIDLKKRFPASAINWISILLVFPLILFFLVGPLMGYFKASWSSGPISNSHKFLETDCNACHTQVFEKVGDLACSQCHQMGNHAEALTENIAQSLPFENRCKTCHDEHDEEGNLILSNPTLCVSCHGAIQGIQPNTSLTSIKDFDRTHPEFAFLKNSTIDKSKVKLNHKYHLASIEIDDPKVEGGKRLMKCQDCHILDPSSLAEGTFKEITFDEFCASCHNLSVGSAAAMLNVPHEKSQLVRTFLHSPIDFLYEHVQNNPALVTSSPKPSSRKRSRRGKKSKPAPKTQAKWVTKQFKRIDRIGGLTTLENKIFFSAKGGCVECHFLDIQPVVGVSEGGALAAFSLWDHKVRVWDVPTNEEKGFLEGHDDIIRSVQFNVGGTRLLSASRDFTARIWNLEDSEAPPLVFRMHAGSVNDAAYFPLEERIITGSDDGKAIIWDIGSQKPLHTLLGHDRPIKKVEVNKSGTRALTWADDFTGILWDTAQGENLAKFKSTGPEILVVRFSSDGKQIAGGRSNGSIKLWGAENGKELRILPSGSGDPMAGHSKGVTHLELSGNGSRMISLSEDSSAKIWNLEKGEVVSTLRVYKKKKGEKELSKQLFLSAYFNEDGSQVATGSSDKVVRLWDAETGEMLNEFKGHENQVPVTHFTGKGSKIISAAYNNVAIIWDVEKKQKKILRHGESILANSEEEPKKDRLLLPETLPTQSRRDFSFKGVNHLKHEYLECKVCHKSMENSVSTLDVSLPPMQTCRTCHEKNLIDLNHCVYCHNYHPKKERGFSSGQMVLNETTPFGYHFLKQ